MGCRTCGNRDRGRYVEEIGKSEAEQMSREQPTNKFEELNKFNLQYLLSTKKEISDAEFNKFMAGLRNMSDDVRTFQVLTFINIINGEEFSISGQTAEYCICILKKLLDMPEMDAVNIKYPTLKSQINERFLDLESRKIRV